MIQLPRECFEYGSGIEQIDKEGGKPYDILEVNTKETISLTIRDCLFVWEVFAPPEAVFASNAIKSMFIESLKFLKRKQFILGVLYTITRTKEMEEMIFSFNKQAFRILSPYILKHQHLTQVSQEAHWCIFALLMELGISEMEADKFAEIFVHILEYDNAYRFRFMDIMGAMTKEDFKKPRKALRKLRKLSIDREGELDGANKRDEKIVAKKDKLIHMIVLLTYIPKFKKALVKITRDMNLKNLQPKEGDIYWFCTPQYRYQFMGLSNDERKEYREKRGWTYPESML